MIVMGTRADGQEDEGWTLSRGVMENVRSKGEQPCTT